MEQKRFLKSQKTMKEAAILSPYLSTITLNINGLILSTQRHKVDEWIKSI